MYLIIQGTYDLNMLEFSQYGDSKKYPNQTFCEEIRINKPFLIYYSATFFTAF